MIDCAGCGKLLLRKDGQPIVKRAFCSEACRLVQTACIVCQAPIEYRRVRSSDKRVPKTCSEACRRLANGLPVKASRPCRICGSPVFKRGQDYCSTDCAKEERVCQHCGKTFKAFQHRVAIGQAIFCSMPCRRTHKRKGFSNEALDRTCESCGKAIRVSPAALKRGIERRHCSNKCRTKGRVRPCKTCGTPIYARKSQDTKQFCSHACYMRHGGETALEAKVRAEIERLQLPFKQEVRVGRWTVDFVVKARWIVEADGEYWHSKPRVKMRDAKRDEELRGLGYTVVRLPEKTVKTDPTFIEQVFLSSGLFPPATLPMLAALSNSVPSNDGLSPLPPSTSRSNPSLDTLRMAS